ncbi:MAG TPA: arginase family protein [Sphingomicrobium sp.]|nr:arginase family protein [Sphingomicrobium sp.]
MNRPIALIEAPSNLGLRPLRAGHEPGTWRAPTVLANAGLVQVIAPQSVSEIERRPYSPDRQLGTALLNGPALRDFSLELADQVEAAIAHGQFAMVVGGDCSVLLGCLAGARRTSELSLIHIDGHSDFRHPGNYDSSTSLGAAAGMDLALATGRGESLMTDWPGVSSPLVPDERVIQIGEREGRDADFAWPDVNDSAITRIDIFEALEDGAARTAERARSFLKSHALPFWIHVDVDVLDQQYMLAVDCPGSPGLAPNDLALLLRELLRDRAALGMTLSIYDPDLDPDGRYARLLVELLAKGIGH